MNIEQAKTVPLTVILEKLNIKPKRQKKHEAWYLSPFRNERTASFKIHANKNVWYDFGEGKGGDALSFVCSYLKSIDEAHTVADGLRWIKNMSGQYSAIRPIEIRKDDHEDKALVLSQVKTIEHKLLIRYLDQRGIPLLLAQKYLKELSFYNKTSKKHFFALGFANEENGYELRNQFFKGCIGKKTISFIRGASAKPKGIHVFEGFMDFLTVLAEHKIQRLADDVIVLNSLSCLQSATPYIKNYGYKIAYSWMDNDNAGVKATKALDEFFGTEEALQHKAMNSVYANHKDVNAWHMHKLGLVD